MIDKLAFVLKKKKIISDHTKVIHSDHPGHSVSGLTPCKNSLLNNSKVADNSGCQPEMPPIFVVYTVRAQSLPNGPPFWRPPRSVPTSRFGNFFFRFQKKVTNGNSREMTTSPNLMHLSFWVRSTSDALGSRSGFVEISLVFIIPERQPWKIYVEGAFGEIAEYSSTNQVGLGSNFQDRDADHVVGSKVT